MSDPYTSALSAVWRDPMEYDMRKHGPPYLPPVSAEQRSEARLFAQKTAAYYDVRPKLSAYTPLAVLLAFQRALYMMHQTHHWQTHGGHFYSDHLLFQRIYEESAEFVDGTAERLIGLTGEPSHVSICDQIALIHELIESIYEGNHEPAPNPERLIEISLHGEAIFLEALKAIKKGFEAQGNLTEGLDDMLQGTASKHEEFVYLLKQRSSAYQYDRR